jgi:tetratricopeptide (TPR) repeat protein
LVASGKSDRLNWERNKALTLRGRIYLEIGDKEKAKQDYMAALASWPNDNDARAGLESLLQKPVHTEEDCTCGDRSGLLLSVRSPLSCPQS